MQPDNVSILMAEDDPDDVFLMQRAFAKAHLSNPLHVVSDGEQAVAYLSGEGPYADRTFYPIPALLLLDLKMPRKNGLEVLEWVRSQAGPIRRLPVVILTSSKQPIDINRAYDSGVNAYMVKPVTFEELMELVGMLHKWLILSQPPEIFATPSAAQRVAV